MGKLFAELLKALAKSLSKKGKPPVSRPPSTARPSCVGRCNRLAKPPKRPVRRHDPCKTAGNDPTKSQNSMIDPDVDVASDMAKMASGDFTRVGEDILVNGRTYGYHAETGTTFPKSGPGIVQMDRAQHQLLKQLNSQSFDNAMNFAKNFPGLDDEKIARVLELWRKCR